MLVKAQINSYSAITPKQINALKSVADSDVDLVTEENKKDWETVGSVRGSVTIDLMAFYRHPDLQGIPATIVSQGESVGALATVLQKLEDMQAKIDGWTYEGQYNWRGEAMTQQLNNQVHVHVPGLGLMMVDRVEVAEDLCTDQLQSRLEEGWRILAICPQPNQRRPDYVLGRTDNERS